jgi:hypothetical protein
MMNFDSYKDKQFNAGKFKGLRVLMLGHSRAHYAYQGTSILCDTNLIF